MPPPVPRLGISVIGQGVTDTQRSPLFANCAPHGAHFAPVKPEDGMEADARRWSPRRAKQIPIPYGHWYVDGGEEIEHDPAITCVSYARIGPHARRSAAQDAPGSRKARHGTEALRTLLARLRPADIGLTEGTKDPVLDRFQVKLLTEGSGTQIFSTTFTQWAARETLAASPAVTLLVRFAPRQRQKPMNELITESSERPELDPMGSLIDADMGAYYNWLNSNACPELNSPRSWSGSKNHGEAVAIGPSMPRGTESTSAADLREVLSWMS